MGRLTDFDTRPRYGHNHAIGSHSYAWSKVTYMAHARGYVMARRPHCAPFVLTEKQWLDFPIWNGQPDARRAALDQSEDARKKGE